MMRCESKEMIFETIEFSLSVRWDELKFDRFDRLQSNFYFLYCIIVTTVLNSLITKVAVSPRLVQKTQIS